MKNESLGHGIRKSSARPMKIHVAKNGEVWFCDSEVDTSKGFAAAGCSPQSQSPQND